MSSKHTLNLLRKLYKQSLVIIDLRYNGIEIEDSEWHKLRELTLNARDHIDLIDEADQ